MVDNGKLKKNLTRVTKGHLHKPARRSGENLPRAWPWQRAISAEVRFCHFWNDVCKRAMPRRFVDELGIGRRRLSTSHPPQGMSVHLLAQKLAQTSSSRTWSSTTVSPTFLSLTEARNGCHNSGARCSNTAAPTSDSHVHITRRQTGSANALYAPSLTPCVAAWTALTKHGTNILTQSSSLSIPPCRHPRIPPLHSCRAVRLHVSAQPTPSKKHSYVKLRKSTSIADQQTWHSEISSGSQPKI